ncbi:MAG: hypothetical protein ACTSXV_00960 [Alphaproteobacteria bacterium]
MKKILFTTLAVLTLVGCDADSAQSQCEARMVGMKTPKEACICITKTLEDSNLSMKEYLAFGDKMAEEESIEALMNPSAEMKKYLSVMPKIARGCHEYLEVIDGE